MDFYRQFFPLREYEPGGFIFLELASTRQGFVQKFAQEQGFKDIALINDYCGIGRI